MNDPVTMARSAREQLARGLSSLQAPGVPPQLLDTAEPIAKAMSALHKIEASNGASAAEAAPQALDAVRRALSGLQTYAAAHPAVGVAIEAVAGSLNLVHQLSTRVAQAPQAAMAFAGTVMADAVPQGPSTQASPQQQGGFPPAQQAYQPPPQQAYQPPPQQAYQPPPQQAYQPPPQQAYQPPPQQAYQPPPQQAYQPPPQQAYQPPPQQAQPPQQAYQPPPQAAPMSQGAPGSAPRPPPPPGYVRAEAELGAHSPTNFYKGLSGNDVVDAGGIFIATYQIPKIGQNVLIHFSMPGGYEFEARAVVRWTREAAHSSPAGMPHSPPGFGAQLTDISAEGRQLVYRYVRNREPLFHDDL